MKYVGGTQGEAAGRDVDKINNVCRYGFKRGRVKCNQSHFQPMRIDRVLI